MNIVKKIVQWILVAVSVFLAVIWMPSISSIVFLLAAIILLPIPPFDKFQEKHKIIFVIQIVAAVVLLVVGILIAPENNLISSDNSKNNKTSVSDNKKRKDKDTDKDKDRDKDNKDNRQNEDPDEPDDPDDPDEPDVPDVSGDRAIDEFYHGETAPRPMFEVEEFGNFKKIDKTIFETAQDFSGKDLVGRWYEDGWLEG